MWTFSSNLRSLVLVLCTILLLSCNDVVSFSSRSPLSASRVVQQNAYPWHTISHAPPSTTTTTQLHAMTEEEERELKEVQEEARVKILGDRRKTIRGILKAAEGTKNYRLSNGYVPELDENGKPIKSDAQSAVTLTAFVVAAGAVALRIGGRAALVSALGLDFATENPELRDGLSSVLEFASSIGPEAELGLFILAWTGVKVFCFDAGGVVLALASGVLFGGVWQGAVVSAFAATVGSSVAFSLAKLDTPVRKKALEVVDEYPSLRGIEKVVAKDGLKAILTLRLAPVLPIPIGFYNYVYGVTNVPYFDFAGGIFLGSLKPYLLDSYLGVFGKQLVDGTANSSGMEDIILLVALGVSVLIGVFASQLANETWESINEEIELEKAERAAADGEEEKDGITREFMGVDMPQWIVGFQLSLQEASERVNDMILEEYNAGVWNYTVDELEGSDKDPASLPNSPESVGAGKGFDFGASICDGLVLSPSLFGAYLKYADPLFVEDTEPEEKKLKVENTINVVAASQPDLVVPENGEAFMESLEKSPWGSDVVAVEELLSVLSILRSNLQDKIDRL